MRNFSKDELQQLFEDAGIRIVEYWETGDKLNREGFCWINAIGIKSQESG